MDWGTCLLDGKNGSVPTLGCVPQLYQFFIQGLLALIGVVAIIFIIFSGIRFIIARGDTKELETARKTFFYTLIGVILVLLSFLIINLIGFFTGVTCINNFEFTSCVNIPTSSDSSPANPASSHKQF